MFYGHCGKPQVEPPRQADMLLTVAVVIGVGGRVIVRAGLLGEARAQLMTHGAQRVQLRAHADIGMLQQLGQVGQRFLAQTASVISAARA